MGFIGSAIGNAVDAMTGSNNGTTLQDFLDFFSQSDGRWANQIDPYNTFEVNIKFFPKVSNADSSENGDWKSKLGKSLLSSAKSAVNNLANNLTGGLVGSLINDIKGLNVMDQRDKFKKVGEETFLEYLVPASLIKSVNADEGWFGSNAGEEVSPLEINIGLYCQEITIPNLKMADMSETETLLGKIPINGTMLIPDNNNLQMMILNTKVPLLERIFYPWMREVTLPYWVYATQPYTTATITVDFTKHSNVKYVFCGCRPTFIGTQQGKQQNGDVTRLVTMTFDFMFITSDLKNQESTASKLLSTVGGLASGAANMIGL